MRHPPFAALLVFVSGYVLAAPADFGTRDVELVNNWGDTIADAAAEAQKQDQACGPSGNDCRPTLPSPRQLVPASNACGSAAPVLVWRHAGDLGDAQGYVADLQHRATARELFDCDDRTCLVVVPTSSPRPSEKGVTTLSICIVAMVQGVPGPPSRCQEVFKQHLSTGMLLRGQMGNSLTECSMGLRDFDAVFTGRAGEVAAVRTLVGEVLNAHPFNLTVMEDGHALVGTRAHAASELLTGWREWITVRVDVDTRGADAGTTISTTMLVSKQATTSRDAWTPPSEPQEETYLTALREAFKGRGGVLSIGVGR
jgi:hypothetical protein